jgi:hypothetical protein
MSLCGPGRQILEAGEIAAMVALPQARQSDEPLRFSLHVHNSSLINR